MPALQGKRKPLHGRQGKDAPRVHRPSLADDTERGYRAELAIGACDEFRGVMTGVLDGLVGSRVVARILDPAWMGERFWLDGAR